MREIDDRMVVESVKTVALSATTMPVFSSPIWNYIQDISFMPNLALFQQRPSATQFLFYFP
ncbi:MAG: hypothetical protein WA828_13135 [Coleofasciculaceae cyanobacterium]